MDGPDFDWSALASGRPFFGQIQLKGGKSRIKPTRDVLASEVRVPPYYPDTNETRRLLAEHYNNIQVMDAEVAEILRKLDATGEAENTVIVLMSDQGNYMLRDKQFLYDGGLHVPIFVRYPRGTQQLQAKGRRRKDLITTFDLSATSLALADIPVPNYFKSRNLFAIDFTPRTAIFASRDLADYTFDRIRLIRTDRYAYIRNYHPEKPYFQPQYRDRSPAMLEFKELYAQGKLTPPQSALLAPMRPREELYDTVTDPYQINNLAPDPKFAKAKTRLSLQLDRWLKETGDKGAQPLSDREILAVLASWQNACVDPECKRVVAKYGMPQPSPIRPAGVSNRSE